MSPRRTLATLSLCVTLLAAPGAVAQTAGTRPAAATPSAAPKPAGGARAPAAKAAKKKAGKAATAVKAADCDVPKAQATVAAKAPIPVAADPLAPTVTPCPPGESAPGKP